MELVVVDVRYEQRVLDGQGYYVCNVCMCAGNMRVCVRGEGVGVGVACYSLDILCGTIKGLLPQPVRGTNRTRSRIRLLWPPMISYVHLLLLLLFVLSIVSYVSNGRRGSIA